MKKLLLLVFFFFIFSCTSSRTVFWCGDHACINKKEKKAYFKKTMTVEIKNMDNNLPIYNKIVPAYHTFWGFYIPSGNSTISIKYEPPRFF